MNTLTQNPENMEVLRKRDKLLIAEYLLIGLTAGWLLGSISTKLFSKSDSQNKAGIKTESMLFPSIPFNGEALPTIILTEFSVVAHK